MHLLQAQPGAIADGSEAVDLGQSPGDIVFLSAADTEIAALSAARSELGEEFPSLRLANLMQLSHNLSVDIYVDSVIVEAKLVVVRLLGGAGYWPYGVEQIAATCRAQGIGCAFLPGDDQPDPELQANGTLDAAVTHRLWQYLLHGGPNNARNFLVYAASLVSGDRHFDTADWTEPRPLLRAGLYWPGLADPDIEQLRQIWRPGSPVAAVVFYRALFQAGNLTPVQDLIGALEKEGVNPLPIFCASLKDAVAGETVTALLCRL